MINVLKKYWFVTLVGVALLAIFGFVFINESKGKVAGKSVDGKQVVFTIDGQNITADDLYEKMSTNKSSFDELVAYKFQTAILNQAVPVTAEMQKQAKDYVSNVVGYFQNQYSDNYQTYLNSWMANQGITKQSDIVKYTLPWMVINQQLMTDYYDKNIDTIMAKYIETDSPRIISHILVKMDNSKKPTKAEKDKMAKVTAELKTKSFADVAKELSDDTGSATEGGKIGIVDKQNMGNYVPEFSAASMKLETGKMSGWVRTSYGMHLILCDGSDKDSLLKDKDQLYARLEELKYASINNIILEKAETLKYDFNGNTELEAAILKILKGEN